MRHMAAVGSSRIRDPVRLRSRRPLSVVSTGMTVAGTTTMGMQVPWRGPRRAGTLGGDGYELPSGTARLGAVEPHGRRAAVVRRHRGGAHAPRPARLDPRQP